MSRARCFPVWLLLAAGFEWCAASRHGPGSSTGLQAVASDFSPSSWKRSLLQTSRDGMSSCTCIEDLQDRENLSEIVQEIAEDTRIVGGTEVSPPFRYPFIVNLARYGLLEFCGGSLIAPDVVLTAAHCEKSKTSIWIGRHDLRDRSEDFETIEVIETAHTDPRWDPDSNDNDILLMRLAQPASDRFHPILLDDGTLTEAVEGVSLRVTAIGWGTTEWQGRRASELREVTVTGFPREACNDPKMYNGDITSNMLCAASFGKDSCQGDSGGPLVVSVYEQNNTDGFFVGEEVQVGIVSWGIRCAALQVQIDALTGIEQETGFPGVYTRMANYRDWIDSTLEKWGSAPARWINKEMIFVDENEKKLKAEMKPKERKSAKKCSDLPFFVNFDGDGLCGSSKMPDGRCINNGSYTLADAEALCSDIGTRLCTYQEITARQAQGSGCGLDSRYVWTSSTCGDGMNIMSHGGKGDDPLCKAPKEMSNGVRCCAEV